MKQVFNLNRQKVGELGLREMFCKADVELVLWANRSAIQAGHLSDTRIYSNSGGVGHKEMKIHNPSHSGWKSGLKVIYLYHLMTLVWLASIQSKSSWKTFYLLRNVLGTRDTSVTDIQLRHSRSFQPGKVACHVYTGPQYAGYFLWVRAGKTRKTSELSWFVKHL